MPAMTGRWTRRQLLRSGGGSLIAAGIGINQWGRLIRASEPTPWDEPTLVRPFADATGSPKYDQSSAAFAEQISIQPGHPLIVRARSPQRVDVSIVRVGESQPIFQQRNLDVRSTVNDPAAWPVLLHMQRTEKWASGLYLVVTRPTHGRGELRFAPFVVRPAEPPSGIVVQVPFTTYQAYNGWGDSSLYKFNSREGAATTVNLGRPFDTFQGAGFLFYGDWQFARWLAQERRTVTYVTSYDLHRDPGLLANASLFVSVFHDEYWSTPMRRHLEAFVARGGNAAFLAANSIFWRIRLTDTTMTCRKAETTGQDRDPDITGQWRSALVRDPEDLLLGSRYDSYAFPYGRGFDWTVTAPDHWLYDGTNLKQGDRIGGLVGYEWDNAPYPNAKGLTVVSRTDINIDPSKPHRHEATMLVHPSGGTVFNAGTTYWARYLLGDSTFRRDARVGRMTRNVLHRLGTPSETAPGRG